MNIGMFLSIIILPVFFGLLWLMVNAMCEMSDDACSDIIDRTTALLKATDGI